MSDSVRPHRRQPIRLPRPWDSPGKNTGVGCHFLLQCMKVKSENEVAQSYPTLSDPMDCSPPGSSIHGILQARILESFPSPGDLPDPGIQPRSPALQVDSLPAKPQRNANQNYSEASPHSSQNGHHQKVYKQLMLERVWREGSLLSQLVGM